MHRKDNTTFHLRKYDVGLIEKRKIKPNNKTLINVTLVEWANQAWNSKCLFLLSDFPKRERKYHVFLEFCWQGQWIPLCLIYSAMCYTLKFGRISLTDGICDWIALFSGFNMISVHINKAHIRNEADLDSCQLVPTLLSHQGTPSAAFTLMVYCQRSFICLFN